MVLSSTVHRTNSYFYSRYPIPITLLAVLFLEALRLSQFILKKKNIISIIFQVKHSSYHSQSSQPALFLLLRVTIQKLWTIRKPDSHRVHQPHPHPRELWTYSRWVLQLQLHVLHLQELKLNLINLSLAAVIGLLHLLLQLQGLKTLKMRQSLKCLSMFLL